MINTVLYRVYPVYVGFDRKSAFRRDICGCCMICTDKVMNVRICLDRDGKKRFK